MSDDKNNASTKPGKPGEPKVWHPGAEGKAASVNTAADSSKDARPKEYGGRDGLDPTRYGDWEKNGRCIDF